MKYFMVGGAVAAAYAGWFLWNNRSTENGDPSGVGIGGGGNSDDFIVLARYRPRSVTRRR